ncbi:hypothetical protein SAMN04487939_105246 [Lysobacter sp. yr284]|uniref:hypothetical protein n=1 Tax=Lysobacter TaxID=68 RepID=UPI000898FF4A|nr:hypothetical protein [Lysobacter sp. yr284]SDY73353.1 hypothetical protein SAMN04487939_105246 [Lysobacter sp. yr284]
MNSGTRALLATAAAAAIAWSGWQWWRARGAADASAPAKAASASAAVATPPAAAPIAAASRPPDPAQIGYRQRRQDELRQRADAGDSRAACQLGVDLLRCADTSAAQQILAGAEQNASASLAPEQRAYMARMEDRAHQLIAECRGAQNDAWRQGNRYLRQAALAGEPEAMYRYARGDSVLLDYSHLATPEFDRWRAEAGNLLQLSFEAGYTPALFDLMTAYSDNSSPITGLIADDPTKARAMRLLVARLSGNPPDPPASRDAGLEPAAAALAAQWQRDYFAAVKTPLQRMPRVMPASFAALYAEDGGETPACSQ